MRTLMAINVRNPNLERRVEAEATRRGHKALTRTLSELALERLTQIESQASDSREGGTERTESAKVCAVPPTGN
jgi:hypothetical protein